MSLTAAIVLVDGPGYVFGRANTCIGTVTGKDMNGPSEFLGVITYAEKTDVYENMRVVGEIWVVNTRGVMGTITLVAAVWVLAARLLRRSRDSAFAAG